MTKQINPAKTPAGSVEAARTAALRYVTDAVPGIRRRRAGRSFTYVAPGGKPLRDRGELQRIRALAIPPAWKDVWICPLPNGHLQATGRDARGRKQYRYHPRWRNARDEAKYESLIAFGRALPRIRRRVRRDLSRPGIPREKALAAVVRLLEKTLIRVGNEEYAKENHSFGLTTLRDRHVNVNGSKIRFQFAGKGQKKHDTDLTDAQLARVIKRCSDIPGYPLFQYIDESGRRQTLDSGDVNDYLRAISGQECTAKDFRTWAGTVLAAYGLQEVKAFDSEAQAKKNVLRAIENVAERLGNTPSVCRKCYVHPEVIGAYLDGSLVESLRARTASELASPLRGLTTEEAAVLALLQRRLSRESRRRARAA